MDDGCHLTLEYMANNLRVSGEMSETGISRPALNLKSLQEQV